MEIESTLSKQLQTNEHIVHKLSSELSTYQNDVNKLSSQYQNLQQQFNERDEIHNQITNVIQKQQVDMNSKLEQLKKIEKEYQKDISSIQKERFEILQPKLQSSIQRKQMVQELQYENHQQEKNVLEPTLLKHPNILKEKEQLAQSISDLHQESIHIQETYKSIHNKNQHILHKIESNIKTKEQEINMKKEGITKLQKELEDVSTITQSEIQQHQTFQKSFEDALIAQQGTTLEQMTNLEQERKDQLNEVQKELNECRNSWMYKLGVMKEGLDLILQTEKLEEELLHSEICLDDHDGNVVIVEQQDSTTNNLVLE